MAAKISDHDLRLQALMLDDPYDQPDLVWEIAPDARLLDILNIYTYKGWPQLKAYCVSCRGHHHKKGFTCITSNGDRLMFGSKCGSEVFGESWIEAENKMRGRFTRQRELLALDRLKTIVDPMATALKKWVSPIEKLAYRRIGFSESLPMLYQRCHEAAQRSNGVLTVFKKVKYKLGSEPDWIETPYCRLPGKAMFDGFDRYNIVHIVEDAQKNITAVAANVYNSEGISTAALTSYRMRMERSFDALETVMSAYGGAQEFFSTQSFKLLAEWSWARDIATERYRYEKGRLGHVDSQKAVALLEPLPDLDDSIVDLIREYRRAD